MSQGIACDCAEREKKVADRVWVVVDRCGNSSAFNGYRWQRSAYSLLWCSSCRSMWRTKAKYVSALPDGNMETK
jgi:hypothetical protein